MTTKLACEIKPTDKLVRFGHVLAIKTITNRIHPLFGAETVSVEHESGAVDYIPSATVQITN